MNNKEIRWKQRFDNLDKSFKLLSRTLKIKELSEAEKGGLIQFYEVCFELSWKTLKDYLEFEGYEIKSPRQTIKQGYQMGIIKDGEEWLAALEDRNQTAHLYDEEIIDKVVERIQSTNYVLIKKLYEFFQSKYEA